MKFEEILMLSQKKLYSKLRRKYQSKTVVKPGSYILVKGEAPIMLLAHLDTVHKETVKQICKTQNGEILMSPQGIGGDDRCGVWALITVYKQADKKPWLLFTCDEEIGGVGAEEFCKQYKAGKLPKGLNEIKCLIEIDRKGKNDAVYYDCANDEFEEYITSKGFKTSWGSFSDISLVAPEIGVAAVNLSSGYYNAHTLHEYIDLNHLNDTIRKLSEIVADAADETFPKYEYIEDKYQSYYFYNSLIGSESKKRDFKSLEEDLMYEELLDFYTPEELDIWIEEYGERAIKMIYEAEFGSYKDEYKIGGNENDSQH